jgi:hypothetical protein
VCNFYISYNIIAGGASGIIHFLRLENWPPNTEQDIQDERMDRMGNGKL